MSKSSGLQERWESQWLNPVLHDFKRGERNTGKTWRRRSTSLQAAHPHGVRKGAADEAVTPFPLLQGDPGARWARAVCLPARHHTRSADLSSPCSPSVYMYLQDLLYHRIPACLYKQTFVVSSTIPKGCFKGTSQCTGNEYNTVHADFRHKAG